MEAVFVGDRLRVIFRYSQCCMLVNLELSRDETVTIGRQAGVLLSEPCPLGLAATMPIFSSAE
jgi:hypothetical protein